MFPNLLGQKASHHLTNCEMAKIINTSKNTYERKLRNGKFTLGECRAFCLYFKKSFDYLFATEENQTLDDQKNELE